MAISETSLDRKLYSNKRVHVSTVGAAEVSSAGAASAERHPQ